MKLFDLYATLGLDSSAFVNGINSAKNVATKVVTATAKTLAAGFGLAATGMVVMTKQAVNAFGELEQNIGGSEAVFKEYAKTVQDAGKTAFENMGLSQSDFLATANKMSSLMQGSGMSIKKSMDLTTQAMQRAADVASIMGIDVEWAMESIAGAAKGNFTMMDNLGVAMNETTLKAYAMEKGISTAWKEIDNQTKIALAMEMFLDRTTYAAGNYARENETLAGSLSTLKAAYNNFLSGAGTSQDLSRALSRYGKVLSSSMKQILPGLTKGVASMLEAVTPEIPVIMQELLPGIIDGASSLLSGVAKAMPDMFSVISNEFPKILRSLAYDAEQVWSRAVWPHVRNLFKIAFDVELPEKWHKFKLDLRLWFDANVMPVLENVKSFASDVFNFIVNNREAVEQALIAVGAAFVAFKAASDPAGLGIDLLIAGLALLIANWDDVKLGCETAIKAIENFFGVTIPQAWEDMCNGVSTWINDTFVAPIQNAIDKMKEFFGLSDEEGSTQSVNEAKSSGMDNTKMNIGLTSGDILPTKNAHRYGTVKGFATGLYNVPYDNYFARLHEGEAVLTKAQANKWRKGGEDSVTRQEFADLVDSVRELANRPIYLYSDGKKLGEAGYATMRRMIDKHNRDQLLGMGAT